jgi:hypothetical protein
MRTRCAGEGISSRTDHFIIMGLVILTRFAAIESFCAHSDTAIIPLPVTLNGCSPVLQHRAVVGGENIPERPVDIEGEIDHAPFASIGRSG